MSVQPFTGTRAPSRLVNRVKEMQIIHDAIYQPGAELRVVLIEGAGGLGKTRMLREVPQFVEGAWAPSGRVLVSDLIDFVDVRLHAFTRFLSALRDALIGSGASFLNYDAARAKFQQQIAAQADYHILQESRRHAEEAFFQDYRELAQTRRIVWRLDTAEQLGFVASDWLLSRKLITLEELSLETQRRLLALLSQNALPNTTILVAGRDVEGKDFFDAFEEMARGAGEAFNLIPLKIEAFKPEDTRAYFQVLAEDWKQADPDNEITVYMQGLANDLDRARVFHVYTGGQPVRLSLYADILAEGQEEPEPLQDTLAKARERVQWDSRTGQPDAEKLESTQFVIEGQFIDTLFAVGGALRAQILLALVRARRGLDPRRLHFILDRPRGVHWDEWRENGQRLEEIETELRTMQTLSFVKQRPDGRVVLQDELYRIYDKHMQRASAEARQDETHERAWLYEQLVEFAEHEMRVLREERREDWEAYERSLQLETLTPARVGRMRFREMDEEESNERVRRRDDLLDLELERLHYVLRCDPDRGFNDVYYELADLYSLTNDEEAVAQIQAELWRFLIDEYARDFISTPDLEIRRQRGESYWEVLKRAAEQEDVVRWLKRFTFRGTWSRAVELADAVEASVEQLTGHTKTSWKHTLSVSERASWREYARTYLGGKETAQAIEALETVIDDLVQLSRRGILERGEKGFVHHPAEFRLRRIIGVTYNNLGYACVSIGRNRQAVKAYANALPYLREARFEAQMAVTTNNLARALSNVGLTNRAARVCRDALRLQEKLGNEVYLAYAHNTLALVYNNGLQPEEAWIEAAIASAYFRRLDNPRGLGLSLLQLGEALRRLSTSWRNLPDKPVELQEAADYALQEALGIFTDPRSPFSREIIRRIEAEIEIGCLFRDRAQPDYTPDPNRRARRLREALRHLTIAADLAREKGYPQRQLDAQVNIAWTHYYGEDYNAAETALQKLQAQLPEVSLFRAGQLPPPLEAAEGYIYRQLSKVWTLRGHIAFRRFHRRTDSELRRAYPDRLEFLRVVSRDPQASQCLRDAAEAFTLAAAYAQLFAPRSDALSAAYRALYYYLKDLSVVAMIDFRKYLREAQAAYRVKEIQTQNLVDVEAFLLQCFGDYHDYHLAGEEP